MIWLSIMLFVIGQVLNMSVFYWIIWGLYVFFQIIKIKRNSKEPAYWEKRFADKVDEILEKDEILEMIKKQVEEK